jgi:protocatechuate 3,4-dioxygenase beta subunit
MKKYLLSILVLFLAVVVYSCKEEDNNDIDDDINISGILIDNQNLPVPFAEIEFYEEVQTTSKAKTGLLSDKFLAIDTTDEDGNFSVKLPNNENVYAVINHEDFQNKKYKVKDLQKDGSYTFLKGDREPECQATLTLSVVDGNDSPIAETKLLLFRENKLIRKSFTNSEGQFIFEEMCPGDYKIQAQSQGIATEKETFKIEDADNYDLTLRMGQQEEKDSCCNGVVTFYPKDADGNVLNGTKVILYKDGKAIEDPVVKEGKAVIDGLCEGEYTVVFKREGYEDMEFRIEVGCDEEVEVSKTMTAKEEECCNGIIDFNLYNKDEAKVNGTIILKKEGKENRSKKTEEGKARFEELCEGKYTIVIESEDYKRMEFTYEIKCDDSLTINKTLEATEEKDSCCDGVVTFYPKDADGNVLNGTKVILYKDGKAIEDPVVKEGKAVIDGLCEGEYTVVFKREGYEDMEFRIEVGCDEEVEVSKTMTAKEEECCNGIIDFNLYNKDEARVNGTIILKKEGKENRSKKTEEGKARFEELCEGKYTIAIESEDYKRMEFTYEIKCDDSLTINKTLEATEEKDSCCDGIVTFYPKDADGNVLNGTKVILYKDGKAIEDPVVKEGKAVIDGLCEGEYTVVFKREGYEDMEFRIEVGCDEEVEVSKTMTAKEEDCCEGVFQILLKDKDSGEKVNGTVVLKQEGKESRSKKTDGGYAKFEELCEGKYTVVIETENHERMEFTVEIDCDKELEITKELTAKEDECCDGIFWIGLTDEDGNNVNGTVVVIREGKETRSKKTENGSTYFEEMCKGKYTIVVETEKHERLEFTIEQGCNDTLEVSKKLELKEEECCDNALTLYISDSKDSSNIENFTVKFWKDGKLVKEVKKSSGDKIEEICKGSYGISITKDGYEGVEFEMEFDCTQSKSIEKVLKKKTDCCDAVIKTLVKDENNRAIEGAEVEYWLDGKVVAQGKTNADGGFAEDGLCLGEYTIVIKKDGYQTIETTMKVTECKTLQETFKLKK